VFAEDVPVFRGRYGQSNGRNAVRFHAPTGRREMRLSTESISETIPA
jgi:flagellar motor switch protein FliM